MRDRSKSQTLVYNERIKALSGMAFNLATALMITVAVRVYGLGNVDVTALVWSILDGLLIFVGYKALLLLEDE